LTAPTIDSSGTAGYLVFNWENYGGNCCGSTSTCATVADTGDACN